MAVGNERNLTQDDDGVATVQSQDQYHFGRFVLDARNRRLLCDGQAVELNARYLDALTLMVRQPNALVSKDRFLTEVWRGVPVTDEALTQCIKTLRRHLGDEATSPRFIETVFKHGYRFIAPVGMGGAAPTAPDIAAAPPRDGFALFRLGIAGTMGGSLAGLTGGLIYGFAAASQGSAPATGGLSVMLVILCLTFAVATVGGAGVSWGIAGSQAFAGAKSLWTMAGGALGGFLIGAVVKLVGLDAFNLLFGQSPGQITGGPEGACLGAATGLGVWLNAHLPEAMRRRRYAAVSAIGMITGGGIQLAGGRLMSGSLVSLDQHFPSSRLRLDPLWIALGEDRFGPVTQAVTGALEGGLFVACVVAAMALCRRYWR